MASETFQGTHLGDHALEQAGDVAERAARRVRLGGDQDRAHRPCRHAQAAGVAGDGRVDEGLGLARAAVRDQAVAEAQDLVDAGQVPHGFVVLVVLAHCVVDRQGEAHVAEEQREVAEAPQLDLGRRERVHGSGIFRCDK